MFRHHSSMITFFYCLSLSHCVCVVYGLKRALQFLQVYVMCLYTLVYTQYKWMYALCSHIEVDYKSYQSGHYVFYVFVFFFVYFASVHQDIVCIVYFEWPRCVIAASQTCVLSSMCLCPHILSADMHQYVRVCETQLSSRNWCVRALHVSDFVDWWQQTSAHMLHAIFALRWCSLKLTFDFELNTSIVQFTLKLIDSSTAVALRTPRKYESHQTMNISESSMCAWINMASSTHKFHFFESVKCGNVAAEWQLDR